MPVISFGIDGPIFTGKAAFRNAAMYRNTLAVEKSEKPLCNFGKAHPDIDPESLGLMSAFMSKGRVNKKALQAVNEVYSTLLAALALNNHQDDDKNYVQLLMRAHQWNKVFKAAGRDEIPVPENIKKANESQAANIISVPALKS